jgi:hypothetical protein
MMPPTNESHIGCDWQMLSTLFHMILVVISKLTSFIENIGSHHVMNDGGTLAKHSRLVLLKLFLKKSGSYCTSLLLLYKMSHSSNFHLQSIIDKEKLNGTNFDDWNRNLRIVPDMPYTNEPENVTAQLQCTSCLCEAH